MKHWAW